MSARLEPLEPLRAWTVQIDIQAMEWDRLQFWLYKTILEARHEILWQGLGKLTTLLDLPNQKTRQIPTYVYFQESKSYCLHHS